MVHATRTLASTSLPEIMLDKPRITEKLTNAWHLLNIHYSDTSSEFQKAERMLNQHSYSLSAPRHHIASRLTADENGTLGPDSKNVQGLLAREQWVCACARVCMCQSDWDGSHFSFETFSKKKRRRKKRKDTSAPFSTSTHTAFPICRMSWIAF